MGLTLHAQAGSQRVTEGHRGSQRVTEGHILCTQCTLTGVVCVTPLRAVPASVHGPAPDQTAAPSSAHSGLTLCPSPTAQAFPAQLPLCLCQGTVPAAPCRLGCSAGSLGRPGRLGQQAVEDEDDVFPSSSGITGYRG